MAKENNFDQVHSVLDQLHEAGVLNLDKSVREMLGPREALGQLARGSEVATAVVAWDGYGVVIKSALNDPADLFKVAEQLRRASGGPG